MKQKQYKESREKHIIERLNKERKKVKTYNKKITSVKWKLTDKEYNVACKKFKVIPVELVIYTKSLNSTPLWTKVLKDINYAYRNGKKTITKKYDPNICRTLDDFKISYEVYYKILLD